MNEHEALPLREATFFILLSLAAEPKHGYAIMKEVAKLSDGRIEFSTGTLYGAIKRLLAQDWIERVETDEPSDSGREQKVYALTATGRRIFSAETNRLAGLARIAQTRLAGGEA
jgi:DNA-binding PadR family transcriptional regulator